MHVHRMVCEYKSQRRYKSLTADTIENGDLVGKDDGTVKGACRSASHFATADAFADVFAGLAMLGKDPNENPDIIVATDVVADMDFASALPADQPVGTLVEVYVTGGAAVNQKVVIGNTNPIGKLYMTHKAGALIARVHLVGVDMKAIPVAD